MIPSLAQTRPISWHSSQDARRSNHWTTRDWSFIMLFSP
jgi:hypothetical protein